MTPFILYMSLLASTTVVSAQMPKCVYSWWRDTTPCCNGTKTQISVLISPPSTLISCATSVNRSISCTNGPPCLIKVPRHPPNPPMYPPKPPPRPPSSSLLKPSPMVSFGQSPPLPQPPTPRPPSPKPQFVPLSPALPSPSPSPVSTDADQRLFVLVSEYRRSKGLVALMYHKDLAKVAHMKAHEHGGGTSNTCNLHSFTGPFACCYPSDHSNAQCMWEKVRQYTGNPQAFTGYEIAASTGNPELAVRLWSQSPGHNAVMVGSGGWNNLKWMACGASDRFGSYCWFA